MSWTEGNATLAVHTVLVLADDFIFFLVVAVGFVCTLVNANLAAYATLLVSLHQVLGKNVSFHNYLLAPMAVSKAS
jgi:hypothetical protein